MTNFELYQKINLNAYQVTCNYVVNPNIVSESEIEQYRPYDSYNKIDLWHIFYDPEMIKKCFTTRYGNKSLLMSVLTDTKQITNIQSDLIKLGKNFIDADITDNWHLQIITSQIDHIYLINLFITNNLEPQYIKLGLDCYWNLLNKITNDDEYNQNKSKSYNTLPFLQKLLEPEFIWQFDNPAKRYQEHLINLDDNLSIKEFNDQINTLFKKYFSKTKALCYSKTYFNQFPKIPNNTYTMINNILQTLDSPTTSLSPSICMLDLNWLLDCSKPIINYFDTIDTSDNKNPNIKMILNYLNKILES